MAEAKKEPVVAREVAEEEFERMCRAYRVETDVAEMDALTAGQFRYRQKKAIKAIMGGQLSVDADGLPTLRTEVGTELKLRRPTGATFVQMEAGNGEHAQMVLAITAMTETNKGEISKLYSADFRLAESLAALFLGI